MLAFSTTTSLDPNSIGLVWLSLPHLVSNSNCLTPTVWLLVLTELYNSSTPTQSPTQSLEWHVWSSSSGNNCHAVQRSLCSDASVYECIMGFFTLSHFVSHARLRDFLSWLPLECITSFRCITLEWQVWPGWRSKYNIWQWKLFTSREFKAFGESYHIDHVTTAPFHPLSNGQAEQFVDTLKRALKNVRATTTGKALQQFLQVYRISPNNKTPASQSLVEVMFARRIRCAYDKSLPKQTKPIKSRRKRLFQNF